MASILLIIYILQLWTASSPSVRADMFDRPAAAQNKNLVCLTSADCAIELANGEIDIVKALTAPAFCTHTNQCLCNRLQLFDAGQDTAAAATPPPPPPPPPTSAPKCVECSARIVAGGRDPCTQQDAYSFCNATSRQCECFAISDHETEAVILITENKMSKTYPYTRSVCLHNHLRGHFALTGLNHTELGQQQEEKDAAEEEVMTPYDWTMTIIFVYIVPFIIVALFFYCLIRHFCGHNLQQDSEMILYRQL